VGWDVVWERTPHALQAVVDQGKRARQYFSDQWSVYQHLVYYPGKYGVSEGKQDTYSVEGDNADLRHYLARLVRRSRCFSRCIQALWNAIKLFVHCYNQRQLYKQAYPGYPAHVFQFVTPS
jgi:insertion element IS1 protein InsB